MLLSCGDKDTFCGGEKQGKRNFLESRSSLGPSGCPRYDGAAHLVYTEVEGGCQAQGSGCGGRVEAGEEGGDVLLVAQGGTVREGGGNEDALAGG